MATHANIAVVDVNDGSVVSVYLHWDGYFEEAGKILLENYNSYNSVMCLVLGGNLSVLGKKPDQCHYYNEPVNLLSLERWMDPEYGEEFNYIFMSGNWFLYDSTERSFKLLSDI